MSSDGKYDYERSVNGHEFHPDYLDVHISQGAEPDSVISSSTGESQVMHIKLLPL
jgi:FtsP/CotA-like multicopper oxidase with cupredoxin domain